MKTLVWGDVHTRVNLLKSFLTTNGDKFEKRIFLGDWFDNWNDSPDQNKRTAEYLVELMQDPRNLFCEGNHDASYRFCNHASVCSGFTWDKHRFISSVMTEDQWSRFKLFHVDQGVVCSHAGMHGSVVMHPLAGFDLDRIEAEAGVAELWMKVNRVHPYYESGRSSGGHGLYGGLTWLRWWDFEPIEGVNQIVGHTIVEKPEVRYLRKKVSRHQGKILEKVEDVRVTYEHYVGMPPKKKLSSINYNIDTNNRYFAVIENGEVSIELTLDYL